MIMVTGGAGFIGSHFILEWFKLHDEEVVNLDLLTYSGNLLNLASLKNDRRYHFIHGDIGDREVVRKLFADFRPRAILNFAAESHVDRSILGPEVFFQTNVLGTTRLLEESKRYWSSMSEADQPEFRFVHVSTDEVYGTLGEKDPPFTEDSNLKPNSPYAASKASSDLAVRSFHRTYGFPALTTNCSNNYGPLQFPEKLIPLMIIKAMKGESLPVYGNGKNIRDWLYVADHCEALRMILERGRPGETYNIGGDNERRNIDVVQEILTQVDRQPGKPAKRAEIQYVADRLGHDWRYAIDPRKTESEIGWKPRTSFGDGLKKTIDWYVNSREWVESVQSGQYREWIKQNYGDRA